MEKMITGSPWEITQEDLLIHNAHFETLFALSNGHYGTRGTLEEGTLHLTLNEKEGSYIYGFYETFPIIYGETGYGYAKNTQTICHVPDGNGMSFSINGQWFEGTNGTITNHKRTLNMKKGTLTRSFEWETNAKEKVKVKTERLVSFDYPSFFVVHYEIDPLGADLDIAFQSKLAAFDHSHTTFNHDDPRSLKRTQPEYQIEKIEEEREVFLHCQTYRSALELFCTQKVVSHQQVLPRTYQDGALYSSSSAVKTNQKISFTVYNFFGKPFQGETKREQELQAGKAAVKEITQLNFNHLKDLQSQHFQKFWNQSDMQIEGDELVQKGLRFNLFHLYQAAGRDGKTNIAAKGLTGDGYEGHYFWDTEMYLLPFFIYTEPEIARQLLLYRYSILEISKARARELGINKGALYAWRTINGEECSAYYPAGTAQVHINADIAYGVQTYLEATQDESFQFQEGLAILVETARFWIEFGDYIPEKNNQFCINGVTGPDEYTALVNNNYYTNVMAQNNLKYAATISRKALEQASSSEWVKNLGITIEEIEKFEKAAKAMYIPFDCARQLTKQDDTFLDKAIWNFADTPKEKYPLLIHYHPMMIYKYQVNKQADVILAHLLKGENVSKEQKKRDFDYYEAVTTHDSSLSRSIFGMVANEIGSPQKSYDYFMDTALMDLVDYQGNTADGIHAANMGGSWMSVVYGFAGMRVRSGRLTFSPTLPEHWNSLSFQIQFHRATVQLTITSKEVTYEMLQGNHLDFYHGDEKIILTKSDPQRIKKI